VESQRKKLKYSGKNIFWAAENQQLCWKIAAALQQLQTVLVLEAGWWKQLFTPYSIATKLKPDPW